MRDSGADEMTVKVNRQQWTTSSRSWILPTVRQADNILVDNKQPREGFHDCHVQRQQTRADDK